MVAGVEKSIYYLAWQEAAGIELGLRRRAGFRS